MTQRLRFLCKTAEILREKKKMLMTSIFSATSKLEALEENTENDTHNTEFVFPRVENIIKEQEKLMVTSIFSFSHKVVKKLLI